MTKLTENQQFSEDKKISLILEDLTLSEKFKSPRALSSAEPLAKQSDPIIDEDGFTIGDFTRQGKEKFNLERACTGASDAERQLAIVTNLIERARGTNKPTGKIGKFAPRDYLRELDKYKDTFEPVENIFEVVGRVRRENQFINNLLKNEEEEIGRPLMPDEIEEKFPRIYNEYIKPTAKELEQQEQLTKQLRESAGGTGEAVGEEAGYLPRQLSAFMRGLDDVPEGDTLIDPRGQRTDFDEVYEGKQFEIDPDPEVEGMPQMAPGSFYEDRYATTKLNPEAALIQREDRILKKIKSQLADVRGTEKERAIKGADLLEKGLSAIRPKRAERFFKEPKKQPKKKPASKKLTPAEKNKKIKSVNKRIKELTPLIKKNGPKKYKRRIDNINKDIVALGIERKALSGAKEKIKTLEEEIKELRIKNQKKLPAIENKLKKFRKELERKYKNVAKETREEKIKDEVYDKRDKLLKSKELNFKKKEIKKLKYYSDPPRYKGEFGSDRHPVFKRRGGSLRGQGAALRGF